MKVTPENSTIEIFPGSVRYSGADGSTGSIKWKTGSLIVEKDDRNGWKIKMTYACSNTSCLTLPLNSQTLVKNIKTDKGVHIDVKRAVGSSPLISLSYQTDNKHLLVKLKDLLTQASKLKYTVVTPRRLSDKENMLMFDPSINNKQNDTSEKENDGQNFTSVKSHRRDSCEGKENKLSSSKQFLQRSSEKSRKCLSNISFYGKTSTNPTYTRSDSSYSRTNPTYTSTPSRFTSTPSRSFNSGSKRTPGLMPDPTPIKRPRLSEGITYSMKDKPLVSTETNQAPALQGFSNLGNTCYMNAILQCLFGLETLAADLTSNRKMLRSFQQHSLYHALVKLLYVKRQSNATDISKRDALRRVKCAISNTAKRFSGYGQHDAHEFLGQVLDQLKEEVIKVSKATPTPNKENEGGAESRSDSASSTFPGQNPITVNFEFEVLHTLSCLQCKEEVTKAEQFHDISLDVPKQKDLLTPRSLQDALTLFFKNEEIEYTCEKCGHGKANVSHKISRLPRVFILHLKRYSYNQTYSKNTKMGRNVKVPYYLTLQQHCSQETVPPYPPVSQEPLSEQKLNQQIIEESKTEDNPSRRKLEYIGFDFKKPQRESQCDKSTESDNVFTETKQKGDVGNPIALDYEEDPEFTRAIQMSLQDQEESNKRHQDSMEENDSNFERVMEMSRREQNPENLKDKKLQEMTEEEMIQLAIEQSLLESDPYHHDNNTQTDDVINMDDHMYTRNSNGFYDDINEGNKKNNSDNDSSSSTEQIRTLKNYRRKRFKSDSDLETLWNKNVEQLSHENNPKFAKEPKGNDNLHVVFKTGVKSRSKSESEETEVIENWTKGEGQNHFGAESENCENKGEEFENENSEGTELGSDNQGAGIENDKKGSEFENDSKEVELDLDLSCEEVLPDIEEMENDNNEFKDLNIDLKYPNNGFGERINGKIEQNEEMNGVKRSNKVEYVDDKYIKDIFESKEEEEVFTVEDEDDSWLSNVDDKENKIPFTEKPTLSDPSDFTMDTTEQTGGSDEVDGFVEENLNIPIINNEKGELPYTYRLVSVVSHMGVTSVAGHYISDVFDMKKKSWYSYDDTHVTKISEADVKSKRERSGYIFFYMDKSIYDDVSLDIAINKTASKS